MSTRMKWLRPFLTLLLGITCIISQADAATENVILYTPYTEISVPPGESIDYAIDVINTSKELQNASISVTGIPKDWNYNLKSGGWTIKQISILPGEKKSLSLKVEVPMKVNKGNYRFKVLAGGSSSLPLVITVSEQGTFKTEFTTNQSNLQGNSTSPFAFNAILKNRTGDKQQYGLMANAPRGWNVTFKSNYQTVTSVTTEPNSSTTINIEIKSPERVEAGMYKIPVRAVTNSSSAELEFEVVITGSFSMEISTPTGLLSTDLTAGEAKQVELKITNTGTSELFDIKPESSAPINWSVTFDPKKIDRLAPGKSAQLFAMIKADKKAIPGDYVTNIEVKAPETTSKLSFRVSVATPMLWGWVGVLIIIVALGGVYHLFRKYGRR